MKSDTYIKMGVEAREYEYVVEKCLKPYTKWLDSRSDGTVSQLVDALSAFVDSVNHNGFWHFEDDVEIEKLTTAVHSYTSQVDALESKLARVEKDDASKIKGVLNAWVQLQLRKAVYFPNSARQETVEST